MKPLFGGSPLFRRIMLSILLASTLFLSLLSLIVFYSNEILEDGLLHRQTEFELENIRQLLAQNPDAELPGTASLEVFLDPPRNGRAPPGYLKDLAGGVHHDVRVGEHYYHVLVAPVNDGRIFIRYDITEIEKTESLLGWIVLAAWILMIVMLFFLARILSRRISEPIAELSRELSQIGPDQRGIRIGGRFADDEIRTIAAAFDNYSKRMDEYVEKQMAFAAMASHELRSPLTIVKTSADLIASRPHDDSLDPHLEKIQRAASNMANMIHALLEVTRDTPIPESGAPVWLRPLVNEILDSMGSEIRAKQLEVDNRLDREHRIFADPTLVTVVVANLVRNAIKHSDRGRVTIGMDGSTLTVSDNGIGIDAAALEHIFDFGFHGQDSRGYGVGLYISKLVCDYLGWRLELRPASAGGIVATVDFGG